MVRVPRADDALPARIVPPGLLHFFDFVRQDHVAGEAFFNFKGAFGDGFGHDGVPPGDVMVGGGSNSVQLRIGAQGEKLVQGVVKDNGREEIRGLFEMACRKGAVSNFRPEIGELFL